MRFTRLGKRAAAVTTAALVASALMTAPAAAHGVDRVLRPADLP